MNKDGIPIRRDLKSYHKFMRNSSVFFVPVMLDMIDTVIHYLLQMNYAGIQILELQGTKPWENFHTKRTKLFFISNENEFKDFCAGKHENLWKIPDNWIDYPCAFLFVDSREVEEFWNRFLIHIYDLIGVDDVISEYVFLPKPGNRIRGSYYIYGPQKRNPESQSIAVVPGDAFGYGDAVMTLPVIQRFADQSEYNIDILYSSRKVYEIYRHFITGCNHVLLPAVNSLRKLFCDQFGKKGRYRQIYCFHEMHVKNQMAHIHEVDFWRKLLGIQESGEKLYTNYTVPLHDDGCFANSINDLRTKYKYVITAQFFTREKDQRNWKKDEVQKFIKYCHDANIGVINLGTNTDNIKYDADLGAFGISDLFGVVKAADLHVGIDSCFGHVAGVLKKNNLTIWCKCHPTAFEAYGRIYRVYCNNYSIFDQTDKVENITAEIVFSIAHMILREEIDPGGVLSLGDMQSNRKCCITGS